MNSKLLKYIVFSLLTIGTVALIISRKPNTESFEVNEPPSVFLSFDKKIGFEGLKFQSTHGESFTPSSLLGKWSLVYIGYTQCPDICPLTLSDAASFYSEMENVKLDNPIQVLFVSADPKRDSLKLLKNYLKHFNKSFIGLRSDDSHQLALATKLGGTIEQEEAEAASPSKYSVFHPTGLYLFSPEGECIGYFRSPFKIAAMVSAFKDILKVR